MLRSVEIGHYMLANPVTVSPDADLFEAVQLIVDNKISGICVVKSDRELVGMLSELDCLSAILSASYDDRTSVGTVKDYMATDIATASLTDDIVDVASDMLKQGHRRRPVVKDGKLVGQISCRQLLRAIKDFSTKPE
jgi:CBS domain-containing protein